MHVRAAVTREPKGTFSFEDLQLDDPRPDEVLVRLVSAGICHTDLSARDGHFGMALPVVLGHEGAGVVEAVGAGVADLAPGDHVVLSQAFCGKCRTCLGGHPTQCPDAARFSLSGVRPDGSHTLHDKSGATVSGCFVGQSSFATHALARAVNVVKVPTDAPLELLGPLGCGVMTGAGAVMHVLRPPAGSTIAVFGAGGVGLSAVMAAHLVGCATIISVDTNDDRLALAADLGATTCINPLRDDGVSTIAGLTGGGVDYAVEATGLAAVGPQATLATHTNGTTVLLGAPAFGSRFEIDWSAIMGGRTVRGAVAGGGDPHTFIPRAIELHRQGRFPFDRMTKRYDFDEIQAAVVDMESGAVVKPVLTFPS